MDKYTGGEVPEGYIVINKEDGQYLRKAPKKGKARKNHVQRTPDGGYKKTQIQKKNFLEGRFGIPATKKGRPRKNGQWVTDLNPTGAGKPLKYSTPEDFGYAAKCALQRMAANESICTKTAFLVEMGITHKTLSEYANRPGYSEVVEKLDNLFELYMQEQAITERNTNAISLLKMYHDKAERQQIEVTAKSPVDQMSEEQLRQLASEELIDIDE